MYFLPWGLLSGSIPIPGQKIKGPAICKIIRDYKKVDFIAINNLFEPWLSDSSNTSHFVNINWNLFKSFSNMQWRSMYQSTGSPPGITCRGLTDVSIDYATARSTFITQLSQRVVFRTRRRTSVPNIYREIKFVAQKHPSLTKPYPQCSAIIQRNSGLC